MNPKASFARRIGNTFPVTLYVRAAGISGQLSDHDVGVSLINETKGRSVSVPCVISGNEVRFSFTAELQEELGGTGCYTPVLSLDAGHDNIGEADWHRAIEIVPHSDQEYTRRNASMDVGPVMLTGDLSLIANGLSAYEMWLADGHEGTVHDYIVFMQQPAIEAAEEVRELGNILEASESARREAEAIRSDNETARSTAESLRASAERARATAESMRESAENARVAAESARNNAESIRSSAEGDRSSAEAGRLSQEASRVAAETDRVAAESDRVSAELLRVAAEASRASAEGTRSASEESRVTEEIARAQAEAARVSAELTRVAAESARVAAESARELAETTRRENEATRQSEEQTRQTQEATRQSASQAAVTAANNAAAAARSVVEDAAAIRQAADEALAAAQEAVESAAALSDAVADVAALREDVDELMLGSHDHMAAAWDDEQLAPAAVKMAGDPAIINYDMFLIDHTRNQESVSHPVCKLQRNNYLRDEEGNHVPTIGITQSMYDECMTHDLYKDGELYCSAGEYDPEAFLTLCEIVTGEDNVKRLGHPTLLKDAVDGTEVTHYLMPWETTSVNYSLMLGCDHPLYMLQNCKGTSGRVWNFLSTVRKSWDGRDSVELKPTAFSPCPPGLIVDGESKRHLRHMFCVYDGSATGSCAGVRGAGNLIEMFYHKGRMMPASGIISQIESMQYSRNDNPDPDGPVPFAEGGYHTLNTFLTWLEIKYGNRYLHASSRFGSGISSNGACNSETTWRSEGGVRCRQVGADAWTYQTLGNVPSIVRRTASGTKWDAWSQALNAYAPKEAVMESQMAVSFAMEMGIAEGEEFEFYGNTYTWESVSIADAPTDGRMNAVVRSIRRETFSAFDVEGNAADFEVEVSLRMSLFEGANISGDVFMYWGGGMELIGICGENTANGTFGHRIDAWSEPEQAKWLKETSYNHTDGSSFTCESEYTHLGHIVTISNNYSRKDLEMTPMPVKMGGSLSQGMCHYCYMGKYWSNTAGAKVRVGVRFRGSSPHANCAPRYLYAHYSAGTTTQNFCGSAQVALPSAATTQS